LLVSCLLEARGIELQAKGDRLRYRPIEAVDADLLEAMKHHKRASPLLALLRLL
jgi:hypothetical protein